MNKNYIALSIAGALLGIVGVAGTTLLSNDTGPSSFIAFPSGDVGSGFNSSSQVAVSKGPSLTVSTPAVSLSSSAAGVVLPKNSTSENSLDLTIASAIEAIR